MTDELPDGVVRDHPLARLTTIRTGGNAELFARPGTIPELERLLSWAAATKLEVGVVGSGSNLLVADEGVRGLVLKLDRQLSQIEQDGTRLECGGGARLPAVAATAARLGLSGIEFGVNIPGTVGGAVRMNANAYGGELAAALEWVDVVTPAGTDRRAPDQFAFAYRRSNLGAGEVVARARFLLSAASPDQVKADTGGPAPATTRGAAVRDQDVRLDLQEPGRRGRRWAQRGPAAGRGRLSRAADRRRRLLRETREFRREPRLGDDRGGDRGDGRRTSAGQAAFRDRARARGPEPRSRPDPRRLAALVIGIRRRRPHPATGFDADLATAFADDDAFGRSRARRRPRLGPLLLVTALLVAGLLAGGYFWVRNSSLSAVRDVRVVGLSGAEAGQIRDALEMTARSMSTLNVKTSDFHNTVAAYPEVKSVHASASFPALDDDHRGRAESSRGRGGRRPSDGRIRRWDAVAARRLRARRCRRSR